MTVPRSLDLYRRRWPLLLGFACLAVWVGITAPEQPVFVFALMAVGLLAGISVARPGVPSRMFLGLTATVLIGYPFLGRTFAYIGVAPLFIGELTLGLGVLAALVNRRRWEGFRTPVAWVLLAFALWGAVCTFPHLGVYRVNALRDAVVWGYAAFALLLVPFILEKRLVERIPGWLATYVPWFLAWTPVALAVSLVLSDSLPDFPGTDNVRILSVKPGDFGVHLGGVAAFLLLGMHHLPLARGQTSSRGRRALHQTESLWWIVWLAGFVGIASLNRGAMLAALAGGGIAVLLRPGVAGRRLAWVIGIVVVFTLTLVAFDVSFERRGRDISARQLVENALSITGSQPGSGSLEGTKRWRIMWWDKIIDYTVHGPYFWTGKGYGINLAEDDGFGSRSGHLRSPHNGHLTILARSGVPGAVLWILLQGGFAVAMVATHLRARRSGQELVARMSVWVLAYWAAFMINATFDVALEGPHMGIPFWCLFGLGLALLIQSRRGRRSQPYNSPRSDPVRRGDHAPALAGVTRDRHVHRPATTTGLRHHARLPGE